MPPPANAPSAVPPIARLRDVVWPLSLRFTDTALEREYSEAFREASLPQARISMLLGVVLFAAFGLLDPLVIPGELWTARLLRFGIMCPAILVGWGLTFTEGGKRRLHLVLVVLAVASGLACVWLATRRGDLAPLLYGAGVPLVSVYAFTFMRLPFVVALSAMLPLVLGYAVALPWLGDRTLPVLLSQMFFAFSFTLVGLSAAYAMEWHARTAFLQRRHAVQRTEELSQALANVETLSGLLPMCAWCKKVRDDQGYWEQVESYLARHKRTDVSHSICPDCAARVMDTLT